MTKLLPPAEQNSGAWKSRLPTVPELLAAGAVGAAAFSGTAATSHETIVYDGVVLSVEPRLDGHVVASIGPAARLETGKVVKGTLLNTLGLTKVIGVEIEGRGFEASGDAVPNLNKLEEVAVKTGDEVKGSVVEQYRRALLFGSLSALTALGVCAYARRSGMNRYAIPAVAAGASVFTAAAMWPALHENPTEKAQWQKAIDFAPPEYKKSVEQAVPPELLTLEIRGGGEGLKRWIAEQTREKIFEPQAFYDEISRDLTAQTLLALPPKADGERRVLLLSDLHSNFVIANYLRKAVNSTAADTVAFLGDSGSGTLFDNWMVPPLIKAVSNAPYKVKIDGNHDGAESKRAFKEAGVKDLSGKAIDLDGLKVFGAPDNIYTKFGGNTRLIGEETGPYAERLARLVCALPEAPQLALMHRPATIAGITASGCAEVSANGHMHSAISPELQKHGKVETYSLQVGTSDGAQGSLTLGRPVGDAHMVLLCYKKDSAGIHAFAGWQEYTISGGKLRVTPYTPAEPVITTQQIQAAQLRAGTQQQSLSIPVGW